MSDTRDARPTEIGGSEQRVLLLVSGERDRELLANRLGDRYQVAAGEPDADWADFDLCVVDAGTYREVAGNLADRKEHTDAYLPVLLLVPDRGETREAEWLAEELGGTVDDVLVVPAPKHELDARVEALLRARRQSRQLALYRRAMDEATLGITITDPDRPDNPIVYANDWFTRITGYDHEDVLGQNCRFLQGPETDADTVAEIRSAIDAEEPVTVELLNYRADGEPFWNLLTITPVRDGGGEVTHYLGFQRDITDRVETAENLRSERELLEGVFETSPVGLAVIDSSGDIVRANEAAESALGLEKSEITSRTFDDPDWEIFDEDGDSIPSEALPPARAMRTGESVEDFRHGIRVNGEERWLSVNAAPLFDEHGNVESVVSAVREITERLERERELEKYETLVQTINDSAVIYDPARRVAFGNREFLDRIDRPADAVIGTHIDELAGLFANSEDRDAYRETIDDILDGTVASGSLDVTFDLPGGREIVNLNFAPIPGDEEPSGALVVGREITDRVERERELERASRILETMEDGVWTLDRDRELTFVNDAVVGELPFDPDELLGMSLEHFEYLFEDDADYERYTDAIDALFEGRLDEAQLDVTLSLPGETMIANLRLAPIPGEDGPSGVVVVSSDITDRVERERELERASRILETMEDGVWTLDRDRELTFVNDAVVEGLPFDPDELLGTPLENFSYLFEDEADYERYTAALDDLLAGRTEEAQLDVTFSLPGETLTANLRMAPIPGEDGATGVVVVSSDITDRVELEEDLRSERELLERIFDTSLTGIVVVGADGEIQKANAAAEAELGLERSAIEDRTYDDPEWEAFDEAGDPIQSDEFPVARVLQSGEPVEHFRHGIRVDGEERWLSINAAPLTDSDGTIEAVVTGVTDITERLERKRELEQYEAIVQATSDLIYVLDPDGHFVKVNDAMVEASGYDREELLGSHASMVADEATVEQAESYVRGLLTGDREQVTFESSMVFANGVSREFATSLAILREDDEFQGTVIVAHDITELRESKQRLSVLDRVLRHNLRNRMNVVLGYAQELGGHPDEEVADLGGAIEDSARNLLELSESARAFEQVIAGTAASTTMDVADLLRDAVIVAGEEHPDATIRLDVPDRALVAGHETFELAIQELLENAIKHNDSETPTVEITVTVDDTVEIRIADDGPGLNEIDRRALLSDTESPLEHTQGLGLWLVRWTVDTVGGDLDIQPNEPGGTVITLTLPAADS